MQIRPHLEGATASPHRPVPGKKEEKKKSCAINEIERLLRVKGKTGGRGFHKFLPSLH